MNAQLIGSRSASFIWYHLKCLFPIPCWLNLTLSTARIRSSGVSHLQLIVWHNEPKENTQNGSETTIDEEDNLPGRDGRPTCFGSNGDSICNESAKYLGESVEREPDARPCSLLFLRIPLARKQGKAWCHSCLEHSEEEANGHRTREAGDSGEEG